eukprot:TRINITY_DN63576_c0_g1_i1.p1 TRINITY_DN63576_c0_g1~~TRINITY_DN63576_c0_g1_i1.p1  ORF type:complete len:238 (+),score=38.23 TRINITY_DN63576_c0_g1_i1:153-866(+)
MGVATVGGHGDVVDDGAGGGEMVQVTLKQEQAQTSYIEFREALTPREQERALALFCKYFEGASTSFTTLVPDMLGGDAVALAELRWLTTKMLQIAAAADRQAGWGLACHGELQPTDHMIYDRFGPAYSDVRFDWHCDDDASGPRDISVVAYFSEPQTYEGGSLELKVPVAVELLESPEAETRTELVERRFAPGDAVAFPSKLLEHRVTPVTSGERRSLLLLCSSREESKFGYKLDLR